MFRIDSVKPLDTLFVPLAKRDTLDVCSFRLLWKQLRPAIRRSVHLSQLPQSSLPGLVHLISVIHIKVRSHPSIHIKCEIWVSVLAHPSNNSPIVLGCYGVSYVTRQWQWTSGQLGFQVNTEEVH